MRNIEVLRNYFLGKDPQLKETLADNSLRLIGIPGREFVLKVDFFKALKKLRDELEEEAKARQDKDEELEQAIEDEAAAREREDGKIINHLDALDATVEGIANFISTSDFVFVDDLERALGDYYTKDQVNALISTIPTFNIEIVQELPTEDISDTTIYLLAKQDGSGNDYYDEYIHVDGNWELIGSTSVDLTNYYTKDEADAKFAETGDIYHVEEMLQVEDDITGNATVGEYKETTEDLLNSQVVSDVNFDYMIVDTRQGERYEVTGKGGSNELDRLFAVYTSTGELIEKANAGEIFNDMFIQIPRGGEGGKIILNFTDVGNYPYEVIVHKYQTMDDVNDMFVSKSGDTMTGPLINQSSITVGSRAQGSTVGSHSAVIGTLNEASGVRSVAEGQGTTATGNNAHAEGFGTTAQGKSQHVEGEYNLPDSTGQTSADRGSYIHIAGNGTDVHSSNAYTLDWSGNAWFSGDVYVGSTSHTHQDTGSKKLATEDYVDQHAGSGAIDSISVNGVAQTIDADKNVDLDYPIINKRSTIYHVVDGQNIDLTPGRDYLIGGLEVNGVADGTFSNAIIRVWQESTNTHVVLLTSVNAVSGSPIVLGRAYTYDGSVWTRTLDRTTTTSISSSSTDEEIPTAKAVYDLHNTVKMISCTINSNTTITVPTAWAEYTIPLDTETTNTGNCFTFSNNAITVGAGVTMVRIDVTVNRSYTDKDLVIKPAKNGTPLNPTIYGCEPQYNTAKYFNGSATVYTSVVQGDVITMGYSGAQNTNPVTILGKSTVISVTAIG